MAHTPRTRRDYALDMLRRTQDNLDQLARDEENAVVSARLHKVTWREIADALGIAQPNATRKFKPAVDAHTGQAPYPDGPSALSVLRTVRPRREELERTRVADIAHARTAGVEWKDIAAVVRMATPNTIAKFQPLLVEKTTVAPRDDL